MKVFNSMAVYTKNDIEHEIFERQAGICKAFAHPARLHLLDLLGKGECGVGSLQDELGITKANMSQHLTILKSAGVVVTRRNGKQVHASLAIPEVKEACHLIRKVLRTQIRKQHKLAR
jgi:DNA-binding transcriptional ArsR family regulator